MQVLPNRCCCRRDADPIEVSHHRQSKCKPEQSKACARGDHVRSICGFAAGVCGPIAHPCGRIARGCDRFADPCGPIAHPCHLQFPVGIAPTDIMIERITFEEVVMSAITLKVNGRMHTLDVDPSTPLLYILSDDLALRGPKFGCGL